MSLFAEKQESRWHEKCIEDIEITEVPEIINNLQEFLDPDVVKNCELRQISMQICKWHEVEDDTYFTFLLMINLDNIKDYMIRVAEGTKWGCPDGEISETDAFIDIWPDVESVRDAVKDILLNRIPLWNRDEEIDYDEFPYVMEDDEERMVMRRRRMVMKRKRMVMKRRFFRTKQKDL